MKRLLPLIPLLLSTMAIGPCRSQPLGGVDGAAWLVPSSSCRGTLAEVGAFCPASFDGTAQQLPGCSQDFPFGSRVVRSCENLITLEFGTGYFGYDCLYDSSSHLLVGADEWTDVPTYCGNSFSRSAGRAPPAFCRTVVPSIQRDCPETDGGASDGGQGSTDAFSDGSSSGADGSSADPDGGGAQACGTGFATDGTPGWIFFDSDRAAFNRDIYMIHPDGSGLTRLTTDASIEREPAVSPDGTRMTFTSDRSGSLQIYLMNLSTKSVVRLTNLTAGADQSSFSHDGTQVAFHSGASVYLVRADGTGITLVASGLDAFNAYFWPHFSANDQELVFDRNNEIDAVRLDGSNLRMIVHNWTTTIKAPSVSPTGGEVAYQVNCSSGLGVEGQSIWTTPFSITTNPCEGRRLTPVGDLESKRPAWGPGDIFAYERENTATNVASIAVLARTPGSLPCILTTDLFDSRNPAWSP